MQPSKLPHNDLQFYEFGSRLEFEWQALRLAENKNN